MCILPNFMEFKGKCFGALECYKGSNIVQSTLLLFFFLEFCTDLKCNLYGFCMPFSLKYFELKIMTS